MILDQTAALIKTFYGIPSVITFIIYAIDKSAAKNGLWRIKESTLHLLALLGGWPGALVAQKVFRHKTKKQPFRFIFFGMVLLNVTVTFVVYQSDFISIIRNF